jgi:hypothetical protein
VLWQTWADPDPLRRQLKKHAIVYLMRRKISLGNPART